MQDGASLPWLVYHSRSHFVRLLLLPNSARLLNSCKSSSIAKLRTEGFLAISQHLLTLRCASSVTSGLLVASRALGVTVGTAACKSSYCFPVVPMT